MLPQIQLQFIIHSHSFIKFIITFPGTALVVQWLRLRSTSAGDPGQIPGQGNRLLMLQVTSPRTTT